MESVPLEDCNPNEPLFYLFKHKDIDGLQLPLKGSSRVKYISFNVSINYIALGTNAGGIHIFRRSSLRHYRFLNAKVFPLPDSSRILDVGVTNVLFSAQEKFLAAALSSGHVAVWELNFDKREASQLIRKTDEHKGSTVTSLCWDLSSTKLFIGDSKGCVSGLEHGTGKIRRVHTIIKEGPAIVQLDFADEKLLVSNTKRCVYYYQSNENLVQIGTKARDGPFGACFHFRSSGDQAVAYCARPGARLWEVDSSGQVLSTQQYKKFLAVPSTPFIGHLSGKEKSLVNNCDTPKFRKLLVIRDAYLMTWTNETIIIIDPILGKLILWNSQVENIEDIWCNRQDMFVFQTGGSLTRFSLIPPKECAAKLFVMGEWLQCSKVLISCKSQIIPVAARDQVPEFVVRRAREMLNDDLQHEEIVGELTELEQNLERLPVDSTGEVSEILGAASFDDSESHSIASDFTSNADSDSVMDSSLDAGMGDTNKTDKKEKLTVKLKNAFKDQLKEFSLDTVLLAGAHAAGHMNLTNAFAFGAGGNVKPFSPSWDVKNARYNTRSPSDSEGFPEDTSNDEAASSPSHARNENVGSMDDVESDTEERKVPVVYKELRKKKMKIHTVDIVSPLQPTDLIKMEKSKELYKDDLEKNADLSKTLDGQVTEKIKQGSLDSTLSSNDSIPGRESNILSRSVAAKQEVVQKARKLLKRLSPEDKDFGQEEQTTGISNKGSKGMSTNITSPLEVKSLVIISRETRKKIRETQKLYDPKALKSILGDWIAYLEKANSAVELVYPRNKDTRDYYVTDVGKVLSPSTKVDLTRFLNPKDTAIVAELTMMCFKMDIFSSSGTNDCNFDEELTKEDLLTCDHCKQKQNNVVFTGETIAPDDERPLVEALARDRAKTKFLCVNFQLLDFQTLKGPVISECLKYRDLLNDLLRCLDDFTERDAVDDAIDIGDTKVALQLIKDKAENYQKRLPRHVFRLYYLVPRDVAKLGAEIYPYLHPWEIVLLCLSTSANLYSNCSDFLIYVTHLIQNHAKKSENKFDVLNEMVRSEEFMILVYHFALILDDLSDSDVRCHCRWPRPGSHQTSFQYEELMIDIIKNFDSKNDTAALKRLLKISYNHGYWQGCIKLLVILGLRIDALKLSLQLGDISLLNSIQIWGWLPQSPAEWKFGLQYLARFLVRLSSNLDENNEISALGESEETKLLLGDDSIEGMSKKVPFYNEIEHINNCEDGFLEETPGGNLDNLTPHTCIKSLMSAEHRSLYIDLKSYVLLMLKKLGAQQTLKIISDTQLQNVFMMQEFYYKCILSSQLENHQSQLSHRILREVNDHVWSSKSAALVPEIHFMKELEVLNSTKEELFSGKQPVKYCRKFEDASACNWGINLPLAESSCVVCPLPLCEKLPGNTEGVIIFPCGHLYHRECSSENYCLACFHNELQIPCADAQTGATAAVFF